MEELLQKLHIKDTGTYIEDTYTLDIETYDDFAFMYNKLEQSDMLIKISDESYFNMDEAHVVYEYEEYTLTLNGDLNDDVYKLLIKEN